MEVRALLDVLHIAERLKDELRHCETSRGRRESVVTQVSGRIAAGKADVTALFRLLKIDTVAHVLFRRQRPARQEGIVFGV